MRPPAPGSVLTFPGRLLDQAATAFGAVSRIAAVVGLFGLLGAAWAAQAAPPGQTAAELIDAVNEFRASQGFPPLTVDPILMLVAQTQSDHNASTGDLSHYGPSGLLTRDDVIAAGYGGGSTVFASENIAVGTGLTPGQAVEMWTGDAPHLNTMLGPNYRDVGAGIATSGGQVYYTLITGYVAGGISARSTVPVEQPVYIPPPIVVATPMPDGSIIHVLQPGQVLWAVAEAYGVRVQELAVLNGLGPNSIVFAGDRLTIRSALTPTPSPFPTARPSATLAPAPAPTEPSTAPTATTDPASKATSSERAESVARQALVAVWLVVVGTGIFLAVRRRP